MSAATWPAVVGLIPPDVFADGAASGAPKAAISFREKPAGIRRPTVERPAVASGWTGLPGASGSTRVSGPGQNRSASRRDAASKTARRSAMAMSQTWQISGLNCGRPLTS